MILTAHQPVYLPWLGLFHKIAISDMYCYFDEVQYQRRDWNNRNKIKGPNGEFWLTVPVKSKGHFGKKVGAIEINNDVDWRKKHLKSIEFSYKKTQYFDRYYDFFEECYNRDWERLSDLNEYILKWLLKQLNIDVKYYKMSEIGFEGSKSDLVLDMCRKLDADRYVFGALGKDYADEKRFNEEGIKIYFQDYNHPTYPQLYGDFISHLSIVDLLFNCGPKSKEIIMEGNITKEELLDCVRT